MICVSIGRGRHRHMIHEYRHLVEHQAELVELRLDYIIGPVSLKRLLAEKKSKVIVTCRRPEDGGKWTGTEEARATLLRHAIAMGVDYVDLEEDLATQIPRFGSTQRIISHHDFNKTPDNLDQIHDRLSALDADIVKITTMANSPRDNVRMLRMVRDAKIPTVGMCMGEIGTSSRILVGKFGAPFTYATFHHERALAPGQLSYHDMRHIYRYDQIDRNTEVYGVIADPIGHSLSPIIHNACFDHFGMNRVYVPLRIPREELDQFMDDARELGIRGISVTIPHKEAVIRKLHKVHGAVRSINAANTVVFNGEGTVGYNTDYHAAMQCVDLAMSTDPSDQPLSGRKALLLGAGGVAKSIAFGLTRRGADVVITNRTAERAEQLASDFECHTIPWTRRHAVKPDLIINATPIGMHPNVDETPFDKHYLQPGMVVFDTVYNPESTLLLKDAFQKNCKVVTGVEMFVRQAAHQFQLFTNQEAPMELMRETLKRTTGAVKIQRKNNDESESPDHAD